MHVAGARSTGLETGTPTLNGLSYASYPASAGNRRVAHVAV